MQSAQQFAAAGLPPSYLVEIPGGKAGVRATLKWMGHLVKESRKDDLIRNYTNHLIKPLRQKDYRAEIATVFDFVQHRIRYSRDPRKTEAIHYPRQVLAQGWGDCDDKSILLASMLESIGKPTRFVPVGFQPGRLSHVYVDTVWGRDADGSMQWITLEPTEPYPIGWRVPGIVEWLDPWYN
jgi:transglutaminase-like putative cysteine protease